MTTTARWHPVALLAAAALAAAPDPASAAATPVVSFEDAAGDATGPGSYTPPGDTMYQDGDFDLRRFAVLTDGDDVLFVVTLGAAIRQPPLALQTGSTPVLLQSGIYLQNVDIYLDTDPAPGAGSAACIPGRRVAFADGRTWEAAVVLTPQPGLARSVTREALGRAADRVVFAEGLTVRGRTLTARVPAALLGGPPRPDWGYSVHVSGARWEPSYAVTSRLRGAHEPDAFTMPVLTTPEAFAFGGAPVGEAHPRVVDVLLPAGVDQGRVLGSFDAATGAFAKVPFLSGRPPGPAAAAPALPSPAPSAVAAPAPVPGAGRSVTLSPDLMPRLQPGGAEPAPGGDAPAAGASLTVVDVTGDLVSARGPVAGLQAMQFGRVVDAQGITVARVMILRLHEGGLLASAIAGKERIKPGAALLFEPPAAGPAEPARPRP